MSAHGDFLEHSALPNGQQPQGVQIQSEPYLELAHSRPLFRLCTLAATENLDLRDEIAGGGSKGIKQSRLLGCRGRVVKRRLQHKAVNVGLYLTGT